MCVCRAFVCTWTCHASVYANANASEHSEVHSCKIKRSINIQFVFHLQILRRLVNECATHIHIVSCSVANEREHKKITSARSKLLMHIKHTHAYVFNAFGFSIAVFSAYILEWTLVLRSTSTIFPMSRIRGQWIQITFAQFMTANNKCINYVVRWECKQTITH